MTTPWTPCDDIDDNGIHHCPYEDTYTGYADEMCEVCCGYVESESEEYYEQCRCDD